MTTPKGFRFAGTHGGIKKTGDLDIALLVSEQPASTAALFTQNKTVAAPVVVSKNSLRRARGYTRGVVVNSGNANACTGAKGLEDARSMIRLAAQDLGIKPSQLLVASTGVIGAMLPMDRVEHGIHLACREARPTSFGKFSRAILTTDRGPKRSQQALTIGRQRYGMVGCTKGAGMIAPNMATTLTFVATDINISVPMLQSIVREACDHTFNTIIVDGDTSTNDMIAVFANGAAGGPLLSRLQANKFAAALTDMFADLAFQLIAGGEGVHHVVSVEVINAHSVADARTIARTIANSPLVKTAIAGGDPNWGRVLAAAGRAGARFDPERAGLRIGSVPIVVAGAIRASSRWEAAAARVMRRQNYPITLDLRLGKHRASAMACDLSAEYVAINADYRS